MLTLHWFPLLNIGWIIEVLKPLGNFPVAKEPLKMIFMGTAIVDAVIAKKQFGIPSSPAPLSSWRWERISVICSSVTDSEPNELLSLDGWLDGPDGDEKMDWKLTQKRLAIASLSLDSNWPNEFESYMALGYVFVFLRALVNLRNSRYGKLDCPQLSQRNDASTSIFSFELHSAVVKNVDESLHILFF